MNNGVKHRGVVVPMVTPVTPTGVLDEPAVDRLVDFLIAGGVDGIFVLGTTGEGTAVPAASRRRLLERTVQRAGGRAMIYAGLSDPAANQAAVGNDYFHAGADAVVIHPPVSHPVDQILPWYQAMIVKLEGPVVIYNMPMTTNVSIPLDTLELLTRHDNVVGVKDSENNPQRLEEVMKRFGGRPGFSIFVGVGALMPLGLKLGAVGIVPSVGNLIPDVCHYLCVSAQRGDWHEADKHADRMRAVSAVYQNGRTLGQSLAALKGALACRGICAPHMLPPLLPVSESELATLRSQLTSLHLLQ